MTGVHFVVKGTIDNGHANMVNRSHAFHVTTMGTKLNIASFISHWGGGGGGGGKEGSPFPTKCMPNQCREISDLSDTDFEYVNLRVKLDDVQNSPFCHKVASSIAQRECNNSDIHSKKTINALENVIIEEMKMMNGSKDHALNLTNTCLNLDTFWHFCKVLQSPTDGHCLLHSTISSVKSQLKPHNDLHIGHLLHLIIN